MTAQDLLFITTFFWTVTSIPTPCSPGKHHPNSMFLWNQFLIEGRKRKDQEVSFLYKRAVSTLALIHFFIQVLPEVWLEKPAKAQGTFLIRKECIYVFIMNRNSHKYAKGERHPLGNTYCQSSKEHEMENSNELAIKLPWLRDVTGLFLISICKEVNWLHFLLSDCIVFFFIVILEKRHVTCPFYIWQLFSCGKQVLMEKTSSPEIANESLISVIMGIFQATIFISSTVTVLSETKFCISNKDRGPTLQ